MAPENPETISRYADADDRKRLESERAKLAKKLAGLPWVADLNLSDEQLHDGAIVLAEIDQSVKLAAKKHDFHDCKQKVKGVALRPHVQPSGRVDRAFTDCSCVAAWRKQRGFTKMFSIRHYPDSMLAVDTGDISVNDKRLKLLGRLKEVVDGENGRGVYIHGTMGTGKTYIVAAIANHLAKTGKTVAFTSVPRLLNDIRSTFKDQTGRSHDELMDAMRDADVLVLDDIGAEPVFPWFRDERLLPILDHRMNARKLTLFTSNLTYQELDAAYAKDGDYVRAARLLDRIKALADRYELRDSNYRY